MKKILPLTFLFITAVFLSAAARRPQVTVTINNSLLKNYEVSIDGRNYNGNNTTITDLPQGQHTVQVYENRRSGIFGNRRRVLVSSAEFRLRDYDMQITVDNNGQVSINEYSNNGGWNDDRNNGGWNDNRNCNCDCKRYDHSNGKWNNGRGNKYGHYKKHHKQGKGKWNDDNRRDRDNDDDDDR
jgi:hypothetical protein